MTAEFQYGVVLFCYNITFIGVKFTVKLELARNDSKNHSGAFFKLISGA